MAIGETIITLLQRVGVAAGVVFAAGVTVTVYGQVVPLDSAGTLIAWLLSSGVLLQFSREVLNYLDGAKTTKAQAVALGDKMMPF